MKVLVIDIGGTHVKIMATGHADERQAVSGTAMSAQNMVDAVRALAGDWAFEAVSMGYPGPVVHGKPVLEPKHLAAGWVGFDFERAFSRKVRIVNDALMQAVGSYDGGRMLFLGLGTGLGSAMIVENVAQPMELAHMPYKDGRTFEEHVGEAALEQMGKEAWQKEVAAVVARLQAALEPAYVVLGGGNVRLLDDLPPGCRRGDNKNAFTGGFRLWGKDAVKV
ncbi:MAG: ROK family protein [Geminicoccaceae bacterium]